MRTSISRVCPRLAERAGFPAAMWVLLMVLSVVGVQADDTIVCKRADGKGQIQRTGHVVDYLGGVLTLEVAGGRHEKIPAARIVAIRTEQSEDQKMADQLWFDRRFSEAVTLYGRAIRDERRPWMRRELLAKMVRCYHSDNQFEAACETFLLLVRSDPKTAFFDVVPLAWTAESVSESLARRAQAWINDSKRPVAALLGASWLLPTAKRDQAIKTLQRLTSDPDRRVAMLAETQLWRADLVTVTEPKCRSWQGRIEEVPQPLRAGPWFVLARGLARLEHHELAALTWMRLPILFPECHGLVAESLLAAGEQLNKAGDMSGTECVYHELIREYPNHPLTSIARQRLEQLKKD